MNSNKVTKNTIQYKTCIQQFNNNNKFPVQKYIIVVKIHLKTAKTKAYIVAVAAAATATTNINMNKRTDTHSSAHTFIKSVLRFSTH